MPLTRRRRRRGGFAWPAAALALLAACGAGGVVAGCAPSGARGPSWNCVHLAGPRSLPVCSRVGGDAAAPGRPAPPPPAGAAPRREDDG